MILSFSQPALDKIFADAKMIADVKGHPVAPILLRYAACYSTDANGQRQDHGAGVLLNFKPLAETAPYLSVATPAGAPVFIDQRSFPDQGHWVLDYQDHALILSEAP